MCTSVLHSNLASKKKRWQAPTKHKNIQIHFWSKPWLITSCCPNSLPIVLPCRMAVFWRLHLSGWTRIDSAQCSLMAFRSAAHLGQVALFRSPPIAAWIAPLNSIRASHALPGSRFGDWHLVVAEGGFSKSMLSEYGHEKYDQYSNDLLSSPFKLCLYSRKNLNPPRK